MIFSLRQRTFLSLPFSLRIDSEVSTNRVVKTQRTAETQKLRGELTSPPGAGLASMPMALSGPERRDGALRTPRCFEVKWP